MARVRGLKREKTHDVLPELDTERLTVRLAQPGMERAMAAFLSENYPGHLDRWSPPTVAAFFTAAFWEERLAFSVEEFKAERAVRFVLQPRAGGPLEKTPVGAPIIGSANYTNLVRGAFQACHLGYQVGRAHEGRGFMSEALRATNGYMFGVMQLHRIMANFLPENARSRRLAIRLGFVEEGLARNYLFINGAWRDHVLTSLVNPHFEDGWMAPR